jgi:phage tail-like protein
VRDPGWLVEQLPLEMQRDPFLPRFLSIFEDVANTVYDQIDDLPHQFDPAVAPLPMVRRLGSWIGIDWIGASDDAVRQRKMVIEYSTLLSRRGTKEALIVLLRLLTGDETPIVEDAGGVTIIDSARSRHDGTSEVVPPSGADVSIRVDGVRWMRPDELLQVLRLELPASVTFELYVGGSLIQPAGADTEPIGAISGGPA